MVAASLVSFNPASSRLIYNLSRCLSVLVIYHHEEAGERMNESVLEKQLQSHRSVPLSSHTEKNAVGPCEVKSVHLQGLASTPGAV